MAEATMQVPNEIRECLAGEPQVGQVDAAHTFLTTNPDGFPHVCLLSRAQLDAGDRTIRAVVYSTRTKANLDRNGRACLVVVLGGAAHYCTLVVARQVSEAALTAYELRVHSHKVDALPGCELLGMRYTVTADMPAAEDWAGARRLVERLR